MKFIWKKKKNDYLKKNRGISFEEIVDLLLNGKYIDILFNSNYEKQEIFILEIDNYIWCVPFEEIDVGTLKLKTAFKSRKMNRKYRSK